MHLTQSHSVSKNNKLFELLDFLSWQSNALANQTIYTLRQPLTYVDNIRNSKSVHEQQLIQVDALNDSLKHHFYDRYIKSEDKQSLSSQIVEYFHEQIFPDEYQTDPYPLFLNETHGFVGKDLLQYHMKNLPVYQALYSQSSCLFDDIIPIYKEGEQANHVFAGIRDKGLYKHKKSTLQDKVSIHADVNGSYNIMKKILTMSSNH